MTLRTTFGFTPRDTPAVRSRIERDLQLVVGEVRARDPGAWAVVLTGGFSRGEGTVLDEAPMNDYDLVVFRRARPVPRGGYAPMRKELEERLGLHLDLLPVWRGRIPLLRPKVFWYDLKHGGRVLWGPSDVLSRIPVENATELPADEATRLLCNRAVGLLEALPGPDAEPDPVHVHLQSAKALLAAGEALLILRGAYHPSYRERQLVLRRLLPDLQHDLAQAVDLVPLHAWATAWKLDPARYSKEDPAQTWENARRALLLVAEHAFPRAGWGRLDEYPAGAPVSAVDAAYHAVRARRLRLRPSHDARALGLHLLRRARYPEGPALDDPLLRRLAHPRDGKAPRTWPDVLTAYLRLRALTLQ